MGYFIKMSFKKYFRIIFLREKDYVLKNNYPKSQGVRASTTGLWGYPGLAPRWVR
jgi:hypothetical protein